LNPGHALGRLTNKLPVPKGLTSVHWPRGKLVAEIASGTASSKTFSHCESEKAARVSCMMASSQEANFTKKSKLGSWLQVTSPVRAPSPSRGQAKPVAVAAERSVERRRLLRRRRLPPALWLTSLLSDRGEDLGMGWAAKTRVCTAPVQFRGASVVQS
jgi:hypothetical protein